MARRRHGFEPASVKCPVGCHGDVAGVARPLASDSKRADLVSRTRGITNQQIIEELERCGSVTGAAEALGINLQTIRNRGKSCIAVRNAAEKASRR